MNVNETKPEVESYSHHHSSFLNVNEIKPEVKSYSRHRSAVMNVNETKPEVESYSRHHSAVMNVTAEMMYFTLSVTRSIIGVSHSPREVTLNSHADGHL